MFITKKHISRRTVLKGAGVTLALPFLDAMVPAATAQPRPPPLPKLRDRLLLYSSRRHHVQHGSRSRDGSMDAQRSGRRLQTESDSCAAGALQEIRLVCSVIL